MSRKQLITLFGAVIIIIAIVVGVVISHKDTGSREQSKNSSDNSSQQETQSSKAVATSSVNISNFAFSPATITVKKGTKVTWTNQDGVGHTVTSDTGSAVKFDSGLFAQGQTYSFTFDKVGNFTYHCTPHTYMHGTVVVTE